MSRILFTTQAAYGHFHPLVPLAKALKEAGHDVAFATAESFRPAVEASGFRCFPAGMDFLLTATIDWGATFPVMADVDPEEQLAHVIGLLWGKVTAERMVPDLVAIAEDWPPDLIVRENCEFGGCVAAELLGIPHAVVNVTAFSLVEDAKDLLDENLAQVRSDVGLPPDPESAMRYRHLVMYFAPPSLQDPELTSMAHAHALRTVPFDRSGPEDLPAWMGELPERPTVTMTLGTVYSYLHRLFDAAIEGLKNEPVNLILAIGRDEDPARFDPLPDNVYVERYIPQSLLFPHCDVVVSHTGFGTLMAAVAHGLPHVMIPLTADQPHTARRSEALGFAEVVPPTEVTPERLREAVMRVLDSDAHREAVHKVRTEWLELSGVERGVELVEGLVDRSSASRT